MENINQSQASYFLDPYCHEFNAVIIDSQALHDGKCNVTLDQTYFYPTGGGQEHDKGTICGSNVLDVHRDENTWFVKHTVEGILPVGPAICKIDWEHRLRNMQHHSGQHLLSQCLFRLYNFKTVSANINGYSPSTLDIATDHLLTETQLDVVEDLANQIIFENRQIKTYFVDSDALDDIPLRRPPKKDENIRIVEIDRFDYSACGGTHCTYTGEIGVLKIIKNERINNKTRIHFITGQQAVHQFRSYHNIIKNLAAYFNANTQDLLNVVININETMKAIQKENQTLLRDKLIQEAQLFIAHAERINDNYLINRIFYNRPVTDLRKIADILKTQDQVIAQLASYDGSRLSIIITCGKGVRINAKDILQQMLVLFDGKGGGDAQIAQGGGVISSDSLEDLMRIGLQRVCEML